MYIYIYIYLYIYIYIHTCIYIYIRPSSPHRVCRPCRCYVNSTLFPLAFTRYLFTPKLSCTSQSSCYCPLHQHCSRYCNTFARLTRNIRPPARPPLCMPYTIQYWQWQYRVKANLLPTASAGDAALGPLREQGGDLGALQRVRPRYGGIHHDLGSEEVAHARWGRRHCEGRSQNRRFRCDKPKLGT